MPTLTPKENYLRIAKGEIPEYVPQSFPYRDRAPVMAAGPADLFLARGAAAWGIGRRANPPLTEYTDLWGVPHVAGHETGFAPIPKPGVFLLDDIADWRKVVRHPQYPENIDWEQLAAASTGHINRETTAVNAYFCTQTPFQQLIAFMGFENGLIALFEEPETVGELVSYLADYYVPIIEKIVEYFKPDILSICDDTASRHQPFISMDSFQAIFLPIYKRFAKPAADRGIPIAFHNCGRCEDQLQDLFDIGVRYWNPAEATNDLAAVKERFHNRLGICGGFDLTPDPTLTEADVRAKVRETIDMLAPGGGYVFGGAVLADSLSAERSIEINEWIADEAYTYGTDFYR